MEIQHYNSLKAAVEGEQSEVCYSSIEHEQRQIRSNYAKCKISRMQFNISTNSLLMTNKIQLSEEHLYEIDSTPSSCGCMRVVNYI